MTPSYEKLGAFYLGRRYDPVRAQLTNEDVLYDSKDLTTHAFCVGMTGSGKTGLCVSLLEEAAVDNIPSLIIDPKGDLGNLLLSFPGLSAEEFLPWVDSGEALRRGLSTEDYAKEQAQLWRNGLGRWGQDQARIRRYKNAVDATIFTPGSRAGVPISLLGSFNAPTQMEDDEALAEKVQTAASGLLALLGIEGDPLQSREHILLANILQHNFRLGRSMDLPDLIRQIQEPPFTRLGVLDLDSFFSQSDRFALAMRVNNLLATPGFDLWLEGEPLNIERLLHTPEGKPRLSVISIAHLSSSERMFFVTLLLGEMVSWMRRQPGTNSLRALLYMDEVFGYLPPISSPPSKRPLLTMLKQGRAHGLGLVLASQNPVDLDYKALSNAGTWFVGRLQTERDKLRLKDGLLAANGHSSFDEKELDVLLSGLDRRVFLMHNVHERQPVVFHSRWAMSYLRGPLTRTQISKLTEKKRPAKKKPPRLRDKKTQKEAPVLPAEIPVYYLRLGLFASEGKRLRYTPSFFAKLSLHYVNSAADVDSWKTLYVMAPLSGRAPLWRQAAFVEAEQLQGLEEDPEEAVAFAELGSAATKVKNYTRWWTSLKNHIYQHRPLDIWRCPKFKSYSLPEEDQRAFRLRMVDLLREKRDLALEKLRVRYSKKLEKLQQQIARAEDRLEQKEEVLAEGQRSSAITIGSSVLGALLGRRVASVGNVRRMSSSIRATQRNTKKKGDLLRAQRRLTELEKKTKALQKSFEAETHKLSAAYGSPPELLARSIRPRKSDIAVEEMGLIWVPQLEKLVGASD
jgi:hypothetical protein